MVTDLNQFIRNVSNKQDIIEQLANEVQSETELQQLEDVYISNIQNMTFYDYDINPYFPISKQGLLKVIKTKPDPKIIMILLCKFLAGHKQTLVQDISESELLSILKLNPDISENILTHLFEDIPISYKSVWDYLISLQKSFDKYDIQYLIGYLTQYPDKISNIILKLDPEVLEQIPVRFWYKKFDEQYILHWMKQPNVSTTSLIKCIPCAKIKDKNLIINFLNDLTNQHKHNVWLYLKQTIINYLL